MQPPKQRHPKGTVAILVSHHRLQLRFNYAGKRHYLSLGLSDTRVNRSIAEAKAKLIESDILNERLDLTLEKYKSQTPLSILTPVLPSRFSLCDLWRDYTASQRDRLQETTLVRDYGKIEKRIQKFPHPYLEDAVKIQTYLLSHYSAEIAKRTLKQLSACCNWAIGQQLISENPFKELAREITNTSKSRVSRKPFSREGVAAIISAFEQDTYLSKFAPVPHSYYAPYVKFLFYTGCRPEEAIALKWKHIESNRVSFCEAVATDVRIRKVTTSEKPRYFPINEELRRIFEAIKPDRYQPDDLVFPARGGKELDSHNFLNRIWKPIVQQLVNEDKVKEYLPQSNCRHTFITLCLEEGISARRIADWCGISVQVVEEYPTRAIAPIQVPSFKLGKRD